MNRYVQRSNYATFTPMSIEELAMAPMAKQKQHDALVQSAFEQMQTEQPVIAKDMELYQEGIQGINSEIDNFVNEINQRGVSPRMTQNIMQLRKQVNDFNSPKGVGGKALASMAARQEYQKGLLEKVSAGKMTREDLQRALGMSDAGYKGIAEGATYSGMPFGETINIEEELTKRFNDIPLEKFTQFFTDPEFKNLGYTQRQIDELGVMLQQGKGYHEIARKAPRVLELIGRKILKNDPQLSEYINFLLSSSELVHTPNQDGVYMINPLDGTPITDPRQVDQIKIEQQLQNAILRSAVNQSKTVTQITSNVITDQMAARLGGLFGNNFYNTDPGHTTWVNEAYGGDYGKAMSRLSELEGKSTGQLTSEEIREYNYLLNHKNQIQKHLERTDPGALERHEQQIQEAREKIEDFKTQVTPLLRKMLFQQATDITIEQFINYLPKEYTKIDKLNIKDLLSEVKEYIKNNPSVQQEATEQDLVDYMLSIKDNLTYKYSYTANKKLKAGIPNSFFFKEEKLNQDFYGKVVPDAIQTNAVYTYPMERATERNKAISTFKNNLNATAFKVVGLDEEKSSNKINELKGIDITQFGMSSFGDGIVFQVTYLDDNKNSKTIQIEPKQTQFAGQTTVENTINNLFGKDSAIAQYYIAEYRHSNIVASAPNSKHNMNIISGALNDPNTEQQYAIYLEQNPEGGYFLRRKGQNYVSKPGGGKMTFVNRDAAMYYIRTEYLPQVQESISFSQGLPQTSFVPGAPQN